MEKDAKTQVGVAETYAGDMAKVIENDTGGLVKKIIHGEEEHEKEKINSSPESKKNKFFLFASVALVIFATAIFAFFFANQNTNTVSPEKQFVPIIFNDQSTYLEISGLNKEQITQTVLNEVRANKVQNNELEGIYLTENSTMIGLRRFLSLIGSNLVVNSNPVLINDNFLMGVVNSTTSGFFILIKVRSTGDIFDSLRAWENNMMNDLHGFIGIEISSTTNYLFSKSFTDGIIENKNARMLYDSDGNIVLMYIFADDNSVIITDSADAAHEVMLRLAGKQNK